MPSLYTIQKFLRFPSYKMSITLLEKYVRTGRSPFLGQNYDFFISFLLFLTTDHMIYAHSSHTDIKKATPSGMAYRLTDNRLQIVFALPLLVGNEIGAVREEFDPIGVQRGLAQFLLHDARHITPPQVAVLETEHGAILRHVGRPERPVFIDSLRNPTGQRRRRGGIAALRDHNPVARIVERHRSDDLLRLVVLPQRLLQFLRNVVPQHAVVTVQDQPAPLFGQLHIIQIVAPRPQLGQRDGQILRHIRTRIVVESVQHQIAARQRQRRAAATAPLVDLLFDDRPASLRRSTCPGQHSSHYQYVKFPLHRFTSLFFR